jgi:transposase InsO family protein
MALRPAVAQHDLPRNWPRHVRSAVLHVVSLARYVLTEVRGWAANSLNTRLRPAAQLERARQEIALLREELRIKDARMALIPPHHRPHYPPTERMAVLELRAARGWTQVQTADAMLVTPATVASWTRRADEQGPHALVQLSEPVNRFPDFVRYVVRRLKALCPTLGKVKIAQTLARAGLHLAATTVGRMLREDGGKTQGPTPEAAEANVEWQNEASAPPQHVVTAKYSNHVWHVDLTAVPLLGFWVPWLPFALPQVWPVSWWVAVVLDHFSRRVLGVAVFRRPPTAARVTAFLRHTIRQVRAKPRYLISDRGPQFWCGEFKRWCSRRGIRPRFGAVGKHGGIAVIERFVRSMKEEYLRRILLPLRETELRRELDLYVTWYNKHRPHTALDGATPNERYFGKRPAHALPRWEPREQWPRASPCATPQTLIKGAPGTRLELGVVFEAGRKHLPVVALRRVA